MFDIDRMTRLILNVHHIFQTSQNFLLFFYPAFDWFEKPPEAVLEGTISWGGMPQEFRPP